LFFFQFTMHCVRVIILIDCNSSFPLIKKKKHKNKLDKNLLHRIIKKLFATIQRKKGVFRTKRIHKNKKINIFMDRSKLDDNRKTRGKKIEKQRKRKKK